MRVTSLVVALFATLALALPTSLRTLSFHQST